MELRIPRKFKDVLDQNSALCGLVNTSINEFGEWLKQNNVMFFTEYTDHSLEHVENVLETAHELIRNECKAFITPHDVATLILATLLHDSAMHISEDGFANLVKEDFNFSIKGFGDKPWNRLWRDFLAESRRFSGRKLIALFGDAEPVRHPPLGDLQQLNGKDLLLCGEFLRRHHSRLAHEIALFGVPGPSGRVLKLPTTDDTSHVVDLAGLVARSHGLSIRDCFEYLQTHYSSVKTVRGVHPVFLMALLRIADSLQIQSARAPKQVLKVRQLKSPVSLGEWEMHQAIKDVNSKEYPETIWVVARPENAKTYLRIRNLLNQIQAELDLSWTVIGEVYGYDPEFREFGLKVRRIRSNIDDVDTFSKQVPYVPIHASFDVADTDLLKLLVGPLYGEKAEIGIRELMQNAIDAVNELREYEKQFKCSDIDTLDQKEDIVISIEKHESGEWWFTISDRGIGMTINTVKEYFLKAGASLRRSELWKKTFEDDEGKSKILRSGRFGIGALAAFLIGNEIRITTRHISCSPSDGIEFTAQIDTETIEIKHISRPVGTTIFIKMAKEAIDSLIPLADENKRKIEEKEAKWDWYCLNSPLVCRRYNQTDLKQHELLPELHSSLPFEWRRIKHPDFEDIHWSYVPFLPALVCNGIQVREFDGGRRYGQRVNDKYIGFEMPNISVFDFNANFPLNIQRTQLTTPTLPFQHELLEDIIRDFIACILVEAPVSKFPSEITNKQYFDHKYYASIYYPGYRYYREIEIPYWISTNSGAGIFCDPIVFSKLEKKSVLVTFAYDNETITPQLPPLQNEDVLWIPIDISGSALMSLNQALITGLGFTTERYSLENFFATKIIAYGNTLSSARLLVSKKIIKALDSLREYSVIDLDFLQDINNIVLLVIDDNDRLNISYNDIKSKKIGKLVKIDKEWEDENWVILKYGECPPPHFNFQEFAQTNTDADYTKWSCALAEWYFEENQKKGEKSVFAQIWDDIIRFPVIPYDLEERQKVLCHAYEELKVNIENYKATKDLIEKEIKRRSEE
jgi:hypothetical protein